MEGGYRLGFQAMAGLTLIAAVLCCFLYGRPQPGEAEPVPVAAPSAALEENG
jgi:hypothetical protein